LQERTEGLQDHNEILKEELGRAGQREDIKTVNNNYMVQVQTLIN